MILFFALEYWVHVNLKFVLPLLFISLLSHISSLWNQFALDDVQNILENPLVRGDAPWLEIFTTAHFPGNLYRPLTQLSYWGTYRLFGADPFPYHLTNILLHVLNSFLVFFLSKKLLNEKLAFTAALFFSLFPIHTETIANISGRAELLSAFFILCSVNILLLRVPLIFVLIASFCALMSKENALVCPLLCALVLVLSGFGEPKTQKLKNLRSIWPVIASCSLYLYLRYLVLGSFNHPQVVNFIDNPLIALDPSSRVIPSLSLLGRYAVLTVYPFMLSSDYSAHFFTITDYSDYVPYLAVTILLASCCFRAGILRFSALWFFLAFFITSNLFFPIGTIFGERLAYLPSIGLACLLAHFIRTGFILAPFLLCYLGMNLFHDPAWRNNETLYDYQIAVSPASAKTQLNYAVAQRNRGDLESAFRHTETALKIVPDWNEALFVRATLAARKGELESSRRDLEKSLGSAPDFIPALSLLGKINLNSKNFGKARVLFERVLELDPYDADAVTGLFALAINEKKEQEIRNLLPQMRKLSETHKEAAILLQQVMTAPKTNKY